MRRYIRFCTLFLLIAVTAPAQEKDPAVVNYTSSGLKYNDTSASAHQLDIRFRMPLYQNKKNVAGITVGYKNVSLQHFPAMYSTSLHGLTLQGVWTYRISARKSITGFVQAGLFSDMKDINAKDFRYSGGFRYRLKHSDKLSTGWGLAYSRQFFGNQVVPFIDVDYRPNEKWTITGQFPVKPNIRYNFNKNLSAGLELNGEAVSYRLSSTEKNNQFIQINQWTGLAGLEYRVTQAWQIHVGAGTSFKQSYKVYNDASTTPWTIITFPIGVRPEPIRKIEGRGLSLQLGVSCNPFGNRSLK